MNGKLSTSLSLLGACAGLMGNPAWAQCGDAGWLPADRPTGAGVHGDYPAVAVEWDPDGAGPLPSQMVIAGPFYSAGGRLANGVASWDGAQWQSMGDGLSGFDGDPPLVSSLHVHNGDLYAAGEFFFSGATLLNNVARWNGTAWESVGTGTSGEVTAMTSFDGDLVACGFFQVAGAAAASRIAVWDGSQWQAFGDGFTSGSPLALAVYNGDLYAGGYMSGSGTTSLSGLARWDGGAWVDVGDGVRLNGGVGRIQSMAVVGGSLVVAGEFDHAGLTAADNIARWDGAAWQAMDTGWASPAPPITSVRAHGPELVAVTPWHRTVSGQIVLDFPNAYRWDGSAWSGLPVIDGSPSMIASFRNELIAIGEIYADADDDRAGGVLRFDGTQWQTIGEQGLSHGDVTAMAASGDDVAIAVEHGAVQTATADGRKVAVLRERDGMAAQTIGVFNANDGRSVQVTKMLHVGADLYVAGRFDLVDGAPVLNVAKWNGATWSDLGGGIGPTGITVSSLASYDGEVIAAGAFAQSEGSPFNSIARWNGSAWQPLGTGLSRVFSDGFVGAGSVAELLPYQGQLLAVGGFTSAGGVATSNLALWDGSAWSAFPVDLPDAFLTGAGLYDGDLIVSGIFTDVAGTPASNIARWDGVSWHAMGTGLEGADGNAGFATCFMQAGGELYVGGFFTLAGGQVVNNVARWNGSEWAPLSSGIERIGREDAVEVAALHVHNGQLLVGGTFNKAGGEGAPNFARYCLGLSSCPADRDGSGDVDVFDLLAYLDDWFVGSPAAELTGDDPASIDVFDLLAYLVDWFAGC